MKSLVRLALITAVVLPLMETTSVAQTSEPVLTGRGLIWGSLGFQGDLGGAVNTSGIGVVSGLRAEIDANTWAERYDTALVFRIGGAYNVTSQSQVFAAVSMGAVRSRYNRQSGSSAGCRCQGKFSDYQGTGIDAGYRYFFNTDYKAKPFVSGLNRLSARFRTSRSQFVVGPLHP